MNERKGEWINMLGMALEGQSYYSTQAEDDKNLNKIGGKQKEKMHFGNI